MKYLIIGTFLFLFAGCATTNERKCLHLLVVEGKTSVLPDQGCYSYDRANHEFKSQLGIK